MNDAWIIIGCFGFFGVVLTIIFIGVISDLHKPPLREVTICKHINNTSTLCYNYWARVGPASDAY